MIDSNELDNNNNNQETNENNEKDEQIVNLKHINIVDEVENSFLDYALSVIVARALPDARDGLKPVHRRILYAMQTLGMYYNKPYKKSARIVGEVIGKYHPHGDTAIYDAMVRMAQDFSQRYVLIDGHGNFGSIDGDEPAAMRYTEARLAKISQEIVKNIDKNTVTFVDNYDGSEKEPAVLPSYIPNLLVNGASGIAVGLATNIPPHNLTEVIEATIELAKNPEITLDQLMEYVKGPDFPTAATIVNPVNLKNAYQTGHGSVTMRGVVDTTTTKKGRTQLIIREIPYMVNKAKLVERIAELVKTKIINGISGLRDESNRDGIRVVIDLKRDADERVILNSLYKYTPLQSNFGLNLLALDRNQPRVMGLKSFLELYLEHQYDVLVKSVKYDLNKAQVRAHIVKALTLALANLDEVINIIKRAKTVQIAIDQLMENLKIDVQQAKAILDMKLQRLTGLETEKLQNELINLEQKIEEYNSILLNKSIQTNKIIEQLEQINHDYGDERRTQIIIDETLSSDFSDLSLIKNDPLIIEMTQNGYMKRLTSDQFTAQNRGGTGVIGLNTNDDDEPKQLVFCHAHDDIMFFSNLGRVYRIKAYQVPRLSRQAKGTPVVNLIDLKNKETIKTILPIKEYIEGDFIFLATSAGYIKKTNISEFKSIRQNGKICISLNDDEELVTAMLINNGCDILLGSSANRVARFPADSFRSVGRTAHGVGGIRLETGTNLVGACTNLTGDKIFAVTSQGYGKLVELDRYRLTKRNAKGVQTSRSGQEEKLGTLVALLSVKGDEDVVMLSKNGKIIRFSLTQVSTFNRTAGGVRLMRVKNDDNNIVAVDIIDTSVFKDMEQNVTTETDNNFVETDNNSAKQEEK